VCLEACRVNTCTLSKFYDGKDDEARAAEELNCVAVNANYARECAKLHETCRRELQPDP
jgi:hypothetical protein